MIRNVIYVYTGSFDGQFMTRNFRDNEKKTLSISIGSRSSEGDEYMSFQPKSSQLVPNTT